MQVFLSVHTHWPARHIEQHKLHRLGTFGCICSLSLCVELTQYPPGSIRRKKKKQWEEEKNEGTQCVVLVQFSWYK